MNLQELAKSLNAWEPNTDKSPFQQNARILQSIWREEQGFPCGEHRNKTGSRLLGSRIPMPCAKLSLANYITERICEVVRKEVCVSTASEGKLYSEPRIFNDLLSSQPLCFNLFAELRFDLSLASKLISELTDGRFIEVRSINFEYSPGRGNPKYTGDRSAFDVFLECTTPHGRGFIGIEVKYHENLRGKAAKQRERYNEIATQMGCFLPEAAVLLRSSPLQQIWRDHLLSGVTCIVDKYDDSLFVMAYPVANIDVSNAVKTYRLCLTPDAVSFAAWTLEGVIGILRAHSTEHWIDLFIDRYLAFDKIEKRLEAII